MSLAGPHDSRMATPRASLPGAGRRALGAREQAARTELAGGETAPLVQESRIVLVRHGRSAHLHEDRWVDHRGLNAWR